MLFLSQTLMIDLGLPGPLSQRTMAVGTVTFHLWTLKLQGISCLSWMFLIPWGLMEVIPEFWRKWVCCDRTPLDLPDILGVWGGPLWLEARQCYSNLKEGHEWRLRKVQTWVPGKIMEKTMLHTTESHLKNNAIIRHSQHGFTKGKSCWTNLVFFCEVTHLVDEVKVVDVFIDFSEAFDTVPHGILLDKLSSCVMGRFVMCWVIIWLSKVQGL